MVDLASRGGYILQRAVNGRLMGVVWAGAPIIHLIVETYIDTINFESKNGCHLYEVTTLSENDICDVAMILQTLPHSVPRLTLLLVDWISTILHCCHHGYFCA